MTLFLPRRYPLFVLRLLLLATLPFSTIAHAADKSHALPESLEAEYVLKKGPITIGHVQRTLTTQDKQRYEFKSITKPAGIAKLFFSGFVEETSIWQYHQQTLRPLEYRYINTNEDKKRDVNLLFDWNTQIATNTINGDPWTMPLKPNTVDKLLYQLTLMLDLQQGKRALEYHVADGGKTKTYDADVVGEETLKLKLGTYQTLRVEREDKRGVTTLWCAPALNYFPIKISHRDKGDSAFTATLQTIKGLPLASNTSHQ